MEETKALTLEAGKYYRTRDGRKALVVGSHPFHDSKKWPFVGFIDGASVNKNEFWEADGSYGLAGNSPFDLVTEWVEPKRIKGKMYICRNSVGEFGSYIGTDVTPPSFCRAIAIIEIDTLEGTGLEGAGR